MRWDARICGLAVVGPLMVSAPPPAAAAGLDPAVSGAWVSPFEEDPQNSGYPIPADSANPSTSTEHCRKTGDASSPLVCKPTAVNINVLPDGRLLYWNGLESQENVQHLTIAELSQVSRNSQARVLDLVTGSPSWMTPTPSDGGGTNPDQGQGAPYPVPGNNGAGQAYTGGQGDMFCSDNVHLADGRVLIAGGTAWYETPQVPGSGGMGLDELQGLRTVRIFDPRKNTFTQAAPMNYGRWYPGLVELADGRIFSGGGVRHLVQTDGTNVENTEIYNVATNTWTDNGTAGQHALPLFPRLHLLPNGQVYFTSVGQMWGPFGEALDEPMYALRETYDTVANIWNPLGVGMLGARSGAFSVMLPLHPDSTGHYGHADIMVGGGTLGPPPGGYIATNLVEIHSFDAASNWGATFAMGPSLVNRRWYSTAVTLPNDAIGVFSGADKDEVVMPGSESPVKQSEWYTPWDKQFHPLASETRDRTYHNTAILLPDASVLIGGHSPLPAGYGNMSNQARDATAGTPIATANNMKDPSFEIYQPPYLFKGPRPSISAVQSGLAYGTAFAVHTPDAASISSVRLIRLPSLTHGVDGNMRSLDLPFDATDGGTITVKAPPDGRVAPPGPYYLFLNRGVGPEAVPSTAAMVSVGATENHAAALIPVRSSRTAGATTSVDAATPAPAAANPSVPLPNTARSRFAVTLTSGPGAVGLPLGAAMLLAALAVRGRKRRRVT